MSAAGVGLTLVLRLQLLTDHHRPEQRWTIDIGWDSISIGPFGLNLTPHPRWRPGEEDTGWVPRCVEEFFPASGASGHPCIFWGPRNQLRANPCIFTCLETVTAGDAPISPAPLACGGRVGLAAQERIPADIRQHRGPTTALRRPSTQPRPPCTSRLLERFAPRTLCASDSGVRTD